MKTKKEIFVKICSVKPLESLHANRNHLWQLHSLPLESNVILKLNRNSNSSVTFVLITVITPSGGG